MEKGPIEDVGIFQPAMLVYQRVILASCPPNVVWNVAMLHLPGEKKACLKSPCHTFDWSLNQCYHPIESNISYSRKGSLPGQLRMQVNFCRCKRENGMFFLCVTCSQHSKWLQSEIHIPTCWFKIILYSKFKQEMGISYAFAPLFTKKMPPQPGCQSPPGLHL